MPVLYRLHGVLVVGCAALCTRYEAEVKAWCMDTSYVGNLGFHVVAGEETEEAGGTQLVQQSVMEGVEVVAGTCSGVLCSGSVRPRRLEVGRSVCSACSREIVVGEV